MSASIKAPYVPVFVSLWEDEDVAALSDNAFRVYQWFLSNPRARTLPGIFRTDAKMLAATLGKPLRKVKDALAELERPRRDRPPLIVRDDRIVWLPNTWRYHEPHSHKNVIAWTKELKAMGAEQSPVGVEAIAALIAYLRSEKDARYTERLEATFPDIARMLDQRASTGIYDQIQPHTSTSDPASAEAEAEAARATLGSSDPDPTAFAEPTSLEEAAPVPRVDEGPPPPEVEPTTREELLERLEEVGRRAWAGYRHLRPSAPFTAPQRAALEAFVALDAPERAEARVVDLCRRAGEAAFLALPVGDGPRARRIDPTLGELLERGDWLAALLEGRWARGPGLRLVGLLEAPRAVARWETSQHPVVVETRRRQACLERPPARLDGEALKRTLADAHALLPASLRREVCG